MLKFLQKLWHRKQGKIREYIKQLNIPTKSSGLSQSENVGQELLNLYDTPRKLNVETFYQIMESGNLELLKVNPSEKASPEKLNDVWLDLQEYYYSNTNQQSFKKFKDNFRRVILIQNEITGCQAALKLIELGLDEGYETLKFFGVNQEDIEGIKSAIGRKETKLEFAKNKLDTNDKKQAVGFFKIVASVERNLNRQLDLKDVSLERWVAYLEEIRLKNEAEKQAAQNIKSKKVR